MQLQDMHSDHISQQFNADLEAIRGRLLAMGGLIEKQIQDALTALVEGDTELARVVRQNEKQVNTMDVEIDQECTRIIARRQPTASDLRMVVTAYKFSSDLERMGDEAKRIAKLTLKLAEDGQSPRGYVEVRMIGNHVLDMVRKILTAFARYDLATAYDVAKEDRLVDQEYKSATRALVTYMMEDPRSISSVLHMLWVLRSLERIGDHAHNIAQYLVFLVKGKDVRHAGLESFKNAVEGNR
ncbi:transcriptional regulator PhoU [Pokkaliibacter plantistimulans]|uniref:Phosphate-specific transport system accessory protein PhoU n=2 Tax=Pseudomonadota TaxID=1224 RepID=A0ABX5LSW3_9GAMM|nr:phosphate signaling complex protein PhoU [Pokkaliibacter plantistimulans]PPC78013.1 phosphate transport system regulatory protein PhoU [Pokkaliibacter plantistimulans]PXF29755.1 transcriptional regulator PhoU [Pokkaliibacter plantistimulans]